MESPAGDISVQPLILSALRYYPMPWALDIHMLTGFINNSALGRVYKAFWQRVQIIRSDRSDQRG